MTNPPHSPTRVTGTVKTSGGKVTYDYVGCSVCRIEHPVVGRTAQPWHKAHPEVLPTTATMVVPDSHNVRR